MGLVFGTTGYQLLWFAWMPWVGYTGATPSVNISSVLVVPLQVAAETAEELREVIATSFNQWGAFGSRGEQLPKPAMKASASLQ